MGVKLAAVSVFLCSALLLCAGQSRSGPTDSCVDGLYQKETPSQETEPLGACTSWQGISCCSSETTTNLNLNGAMQLYNFTWELCGTPSSQCRRYLLNEQCFYECEPILDYFQIEAIPGAVTNIPVCASYCDDWFEACREDLTCVENWLDNLNQAYLEGANTCPAQSECRTFAEVFVDGRGLCNKMWGSGFFYSEDTNNCTVMEFDPESPNPNFQLIFGSGAAEKLKSSILFSGTLAVLVVLAYFNI